MTGGFFQRIEVAESIAFFDQALWLNTTCGMQQGLCQTGFACRAMPNQGNGADGFCYNRA
jgi:hypothetical protein